MSRWTVQAESKGGTKIHKSFQKLDQALDWIEKYSEMGVHYKIEKVES